MFRSFDTRTAALALMAGLDAVVVTAAAQGHGPTELARIGRELSDMDVRAIAPEGETTR